MKKIILWCSAAVLSLTVVAAPLVMAQPVQGDNAGTGPVIGTAGTFGSTVTADNFVATAATVNYTMSSNGRLYYQGAGSNYVKGNASGHLEGTAGFQSSIASGSDGFVFTNEGEIQWPDTKIAESGTTVVVTAASGIQTTGDTISMTNTSSQSFYCAGATGLCEFVSNLGDATTSPTVGAVRIKANNNIADTDLIAAFTNSANITVAGVNEDGAVDIGSFTDDSATTGNRTVNKQCGINAFAAAATAITITNSYVTAATAVLCTLNTNDATATLKNCATAAGSFTATITAGATGTTKLAWCVVGF
jgi:hypothetical protein